MSVESVLSGVALAFFKLIIGLAFSIGAIYSGIGLLDRLTPNLDEWKEIKKGNLSVGILLAGIVISVAVIIETGVKSAIDSIVPSIAFPALLALLLVALIKLFLGLMFAMVAVYLALKIMDKMTPDIDEMAELKKGNVAVAVILAMVMISISFVIKSAVESFMAIVDLSMVSSLLGL